MSIARHKKSRFWALTRHGRRAGLRLRVQERRAGGSEAITTGEYALFVPPIGAQGRRTQE